MALMEERMSFGLMGYRARLASLSVITFHSREICQLVPVIGKDPNTSSKETLSRFSLAELYRIPILDKNTYIDYRND